MKPEDVLKPLLARVQLPKTVVELLYFLLLREIEGFPTHPWAQQYYKDQPEKIGARYVNSLLGLFQRIPRITDKTESLFSVPIFQLAGISREELKYQIYPGLREDEARRKNDPPVSFYYDKLWDDLLNFNVSFEIPTKLRFQHLHVCGATGSGKTSLLEKLIYADIQTDAAVIVMTLKGALLNSIARVVEPDRLIHLSPDNPIPLNVFDLGTESDSAVGLINQIFSELLTDAETTGKQTPVLNHSIRLLLKVEGASLTNLRAILKSPALSSEYWPYVELLSESGQEFFHERFSSKSYTDTKEQLLWRLDLLLENTIVQKIFCQPKTELNMAEVMREGKILLIDTSVKQMGEYGSSFLGRFFLALVTIAAQQRTEKRPVFFYVDEAGSYITPNIETILERTREANVGLTIAHQQLSQLKGLEASVMTNTATKVVGRCNEADAKKFASSLRVDWERLQHQPDLQFHLSILGLPTMQIKVQPGFLQKQPMKNHGEHRGSSRPSPEPKKSDQSTPDPGTAASSEW